jgi:two-component system, OmpR family, alkaline phosphatase synthesis response regulator PhoP
MAEDKKVFVCDDDLEILTSLRKLLELSGLKVMTTDKPREVLAMVKSFEPDVILLDLMMPDMNGLEVCEVLNKDETTGKIPIFIISALSDYMDIRKAYKLGVTGYFTKPYNFADVLKEIEKAIDFKRNIL